MQLPMADILIDTKLPSVTGTPPISTCLMYVMADSTNNHTHLY